MTKVENVGISQTKLTVLSLCVGNDRRIAQMLEARADLVENFIGYVQGQNEQDPEVRDRYLEAIKNIDIHPDKTQICLSNGLARNWFSNRVTRMATKIVWPTRVK